MFSKVSPLWTGCTCVFRAPWNLGTCAHCSPSQPTLPVEPCGMSPCTCVSHLLLSYACRFPEPPPLGCPACSSSCLSSLESRLSSAVHWDCCCQLGRHRLPAPQLGKCPVQEVRASLLSSSSLRVTALPAVLCLKTVVSFILFSFAFA